MITVTTFDRVLCTYHFDGHVAELLEREAQLARVDFYTRYRLMQCTVHTVNDYGMVSERITV